MFQKIRRYIYLILGKLDELLGIENKQVIYCLHAIDEKWYHSNTSDFVKKLVLSLKVRGYEPSTLSSLFDNVRNRRKNFYITFDDGYKSITNLEPFFKKEGVSPTVFLVGDVNNVNKSQLGNDLKFLDKKDIKHLSKNGWTFGSHSMTHCDFYNLKKPNDIALEVSMSKLTLENQLGICIKYFAFPKGRYSKKILKEVKSAGYNLAMTMDDELIGTNTNKLLVPRIGLDSTHTLKEAIASSSSTVVFMRSVVKFFLKYIKKI